MKKVIAGAVVVIIIVLAGYGIRNADNKPGTIKIGLIGILSGEYASVGENMRNGAVLAQEKWNKEHADQQVELVTEDDGFSSAKGIAAYRKLTSIDHVQAIINMSSPTIDGIYEEVTKTTLPILQFGEQSIEPADDNVVGMFPNSIEAEYKYGKYLREQGYTNIAVVYTRNSTLERFVKGFKSGFQGKTTDYVLEPDQKDFRTTALKVSETKPSMVAFIVTPTTGGLFMKEYLKISSPENRKFFFDTSFQSGFEDYKRILGDVSILDGTLVGTIKATVADEFKKEYKERFGKDAGFFADMGYDGFNVIVQSYDSNQKKWVENLKKYKSTGASGSIEFDSKGNRTPDSKMMVVRKGIISEIQ